MYKIFIVNNNELITPYFVKSNFDSINTLYDKALKILEKNIIQTKKLFYDLNYIYYN